MFNLNNNLMGEEEPVKIEESVADWETGLPSVDDLTPLSQSLIPAELASAFEISAETPRTMLEVNRASQTTFSSLNSVAPNFKPYADDQLMAESESPEEIGGYDPKRIRATDDEAIDDSAAEQGKSSKRPRLVWTPQLHKRFVEVVAHLGLKNAVPKTIMQLMNVEGLTRENVASHLQKYRLYVKRNQENDDNSPSDNLFASTPLQHTQSFNELYSGQGNVNSNRSQGNNNIHGNNHVEMHMQMPMMGMAAGNVNYPEGYHGYEGGSSLHHHHHYHHHYQQQYGNMAQQQKEWSGNNYKNNAFSHHLAQK